MLHPCLFYNGHHATSALILFKQDDRCNKIHLEKIIKHFSFFSSVVATLLITRQLVAGVQLVNGSFVNEVRCSQAHSKRRKRAGDKS